MKLFEVQMDKLNLGMVINNDPCYPYLMRCNHTVDQKLVMAHVYATATVIFSRTTPASPTPAAR